MTLEHIDHSLYEDLLNDDHASTKRFNVLQNPAREKRVLELYYTIKEKEAQIERYNNTLFSIHQGIKNEKDMFKKIQEQNRYKMIEKNRDNALNELIGLREELEIVRRLVEYKFMEKSKAKKSKAKKSKAKKSLAKRRNRSIRK